MKILQLIPTRSGGGAERQATYAALALEKRGHEVLFGYVHDGAGEAPAGLSTHRFRAQGGWSPMLFAEIVRLIRSYEPDVVLTCLPRMDVAGGLAAWLCGVPWVLREPNVGASYDSVASRVRAMAGRVAASVVVSNSDAGAGYWRVVAPQVPRFLIRNGVPVDEIEDVAVPHRDSRAPIVVYTGRLEPEKNVDIMLRAAAEVMKERELTLVICGEGTQRAALDALAGELGIRNVVAFEGFVRDPWSRQRSADFAMQLSAYEGHPNAVAECFAGSIPMILSDIPEHREFAGDDVALFVAERDVSATARAMRVMLDDPPAARVRAARARAVASTWTIDTMGDAWEHLLEEVVSAAQRSAGRWRVRRLRASLLAAGRLQAQPVRESKRGG